MTRRFHAAARRPRQMSLRSPPPSHNNSVAQTSLHPANVIKTLLQTKGSFGAILPLTWTTLSRGAGAQFLLSLPNGALHFAVLEVGDTGVLETVVWNMCFGRESGTHNMYHRGKDNAPLHDRISALYIFFARKYTVKFGDLTEFSKSKGHAVGSFANNGLLLRCLHTISRPCYCVSYRNRILTVGNLGLQPETFGVVRSVSAVART